MIGDSRWPWKTLPVIVVLLVAHLIVNLKLPPMVVLRNPYAEMVFKSTIARFFDAPEHRALGNSIELLFPGQNVSGSNFSFHQHHLNDEFSFGDLVAYFGDYMGATSKSKIVCLGATPLDRQNKALALFGEWYNQTNQKQEPKYLDMFKGLAAGARSWHDIGFNTTLFYDFMGLSYGEMWDTKNELRWNWDHFVNPHNCSHKAYLAFHSIALQMAAKAGDMANSSMPDSITRLRMAYVVEAFGFHFLTDSFAAGHMRSKGMFVCWLYHQHDAQRG